MARATYPPATMSRRAEDSPPPDAQPPWSQEANASQKVLDPLNDNDTEADIPTSPDESQGSPVLRRAPLLLETTSTPPSPAAATADDYEIFEPTESV